MITKYLVFSLLVCSTYCFSQTQTLRVLGQYSYETKLESLGAIVTLAENPNKCDPVKGFVSLEDQFRHLSESIKARGSKSILVPTDDFSYSGFRKKSYKIEEANADLFNQILEVCNQHEATIDKLYYKLPKHDYEGEDNNAIAALNDAKRKADELSKHLNCSVVKILNIDDDTRDVYSFYDTEKLELLKLLGRLESAQLIATQSKTPSRNGKYNLWVTFEIEDK